ncbi:DUF294 nucleotidyltransferase-like domain-containing protein [Jeotgalibacillus proteolyticus]|uniref:Signal transduction protein n=1 Tax=Jeotgalibacillus proteolyticus TaxID=2082395 RepID=A0A2S5GA16_9BACL|nr:DUF294 nucleotidyltransferase-like domain-containing protein [Jeotgalibacillus proteolyticus]PPA69765.1 hypothetical protein C4B60_14610 [Jeotgalibacillus proteolyticus]
MTEKTFRQPNNHEHSIRKFVKETPLFKKKSGPEFDRLYEQCEERLYDKGNLIAHAKKRREGILLITFGLAEVYASGYQHEREVLELAGPGEVIGLASLSNMLRPSGESTNTVEIQALETTLGLFIPYKVLEGIWKEKEVQQFFLEKTIFRLRDVYQSFTDQLQQSSWMDSQRQVFQRVQNIMSSPLLTLSSDSTIKEGMRFMTEHNLSAVVCLNSLSRPIVISMREMIKALAEDRALTTSLRELPVKDATVISRSAYYYDALTIFQQKPDLRHVVVTDEQENPVGMLTLSDVLKQRHRSIQQVMKQIHQLSYASIEEVSSELKKVSAQLIDERESIRLMTSTIRPLFDQVVIEIVKLAQNQINEENGKTPPCSFSFYQMGSAGRGEQLQMTDQDHFLVYEKSGSQVDEYFALLGNKIVELLEKIGFKRCDGDMMASNRLWRGSVEMWQQRIHRFATKSTPQNILYAYNFFAMRWITGSSSLHQAFTAMIEEEIKSSGVLLSQMGQELRSMLIPQIDHRLRSLLLREGKTIDLKKQVLFPFHHALQIRGLLNRIADGSTVERVDSLLAKGQLTEEEAEELKESIDCVLLLNLQQKQKDGTSRIVADQLTSRDKALLSRALKVLREFQMNVIRGFGA